MKYQKLAMLAIWISMPFPPYFARSANLACSARIVSLLFKRLPYAKRKTESFELEYLPVMNVRR